MNVLIDLHYLPCLNYFRLMTAASQFILEVDENYQKQSYRNRTTILTCHGANSLTIPVKKALHTPIQTVEIDYSQNWHKQHWKSIQSAYGKSPYFEHYAHRFEEIYKKEHLFLFDLNRDFLHLCLTIIGISFPLLNTTSFQKEVTPSVIDFRNLIHPKKSFLFQENGTYKSYIQLFGDSYIDNLSILDLIFCEGPNSLSILKSNKENE